MSRTQKKCLIASGALHVLLLIILLVTPAFLLREEPPVDQTVLTLVNTEVAAEAPAVVTPPPQEPITTPPKKPERKQPDPPKEKITPKPPPESEPEPKPKPERKPVEIKISEPTPKPVVEKKPKSTWKPKSADSITFTDVKQTSPAQRRQNEERQQAIDEAMKQASNVDIVKTDLKPTTLARGYTGDDYSSVVSGVYYRNWNPPNNISSKNTIVTVRVVIRRDGTVKSAKIIKKSGSSALNANITNLIKKRVTRMPKPFPANTSDKERTYDIDFKPQSEVLRIMFYRQLLLSAFVAIAFLFNSTQAAEPRKIVIEREGWTGFEDPIPIALSGYSGEVLSTLKFDLFVQGFKIVPSDQADYVLSGKNATRVEGRLKSRIGGGSELVAKAYNGGSLRQQAHALANDVVKAVRAIDGVGRTKIAYRVYKGKGVYEIYVSDFDGQRPKAATADGALVAAPTWMPGRNALLYSTYKNRFADIVSHDLTTGSRKTVANFAGNNHSPAVSPDGKMVAMTLTKVGNSTDLWVTDINGQNPKRLTRTKGAESSPTWSPDSKTICFTSDEGGQGALYTISASGGTMKRVQGTFGICTEPDWSPDGRWIAYTRQVGSNFTLWIVDVKRNQARELIPGEDPSWAPNSRNLMFTRNQSRLSVLDVPTKQSKDIARVSGKSTQASWAR